MAHTFFFATSLFAVLASVVLATNTSCFPGDATVQMYNGDLKLMRDLEVGDKVAVSKNVFSDVYAFGHKDADVSSEFIQVHTASDMIELSKGHFIPVDAKGKLVYKGAKDLQVGETLWGSSEITELSKVEKLGLYNPFTLSGNIMVNNVDTASGSWTLSLMPLAQLSTSHMHTRPCSLHFAPQHRREGNLWKGLCCRQFLCQHC
ncbi:warthog protein 6 isoform X3 [Selaginella moellendorffii]|uniref:warthog protein 6 isoform X3 n=1 Tax=Selaginella moellendorffii TaxID=88036 RepID=UPI000D1D0248|nr:warthog protein 6 isoform X3 [Selaginella moellendorffii]|eukprot:XP_024521177.1 warthog protein 6 isoform X3 [Selaginella moellendorffii]